MRRLLVVSVAVTVGVGCAAQTKGKAVPVSVIEAAPITAPAAAAAHAGEPPIAILEVETPKEPDDEVLGAKASKPCREGTPEHKSAELALDALSAKIGALDDKASAKALTAELTSLLDTPCFELARRDHELWGDTLEFDSGLALKAWWSDGERWLREYGSLATSRWLTMPGTPRHSLFLENHKTHPLASLLCPATPGDCGKETTGWMRRADKVLKRDVTGFRTQEDCEEKIKKKEIPAAEKYVAFLQCKKDQVDSHEALPLGRFKAPTDGLFVIEGRSPSSTSAHDCTELRIYDVATGAAQIAESCRRSSSTQVNPRVSTGKVPVAALREALFMLMFASTVDKDVRSAEMLRIPDGVVIGRSADEHLSLHGFGFCGGGSRVIRPWTWMRKDPNNSGALVGQVSGRLITPAYRNPAAEHAGDLMGVFEDNFTAGCSPKMSALPNAIAWNKPGPSLNKSEEKVAFDRPELDALRTPLLKAPAAPICTSAP